MDWRNRKYYVIKIPSNSIDYRISILKHIPKIRLHTPPEHFEYHQQIHDELIARGKYDFLIGCNYLDSDIVEFELRKAERNDKAKWREIKKNIKSEQHDDK